MPVSKIDENMETAHNRGSVLTKKFWFRKDFKSSDKSLVELTANEIMNGSENFSGIIPLVRQFLDEKKGAEIDDETYKKLNCYLQFISERASGKLSTNATWIREFVTSHPAYDKNSVVSHEIAYDLFVTIDKIQKKIIKEPKLYGDFY